MQGVSGADPAALEVLSRELRVAGEELERARRGIQAVLADVGREAPTSLGARIQWAQESARDVQRRARSIAWTNFRAGEAGLGPVVARPPTDFRSFAAAQRAARDFAADVADADADAHAYLDLVAGLERHANDAVFLAAFIEAFGAERFAALPRVVQAIEYGDVLGVTLLPSTRLRVDIRSVAWEGDPVGDLLAPLSNALAVATRSGFLPRDVERRIVRHDDPWAVGQLVHAGEFGTDFLVDAFVEVVVPDLVVREQMALLGWDRSEPFAIGARLGDDHVGIDAAVLVLGALGRSPAAARRVAVERFEDPVAIPTRLYLHEEDDVFGLVTKTLYEDDGESVGAMLTAGVQGLHAAGETADALRLTERMVGAALADRARNGPGLVDGLSTVLAEHHVADLHWSAAAGVVERDFGSGDGHAVGQRLLLSRLQLTDLLVAVADRPGARDVLLDAVAAFQTERIAAAATSDASLRWAVEIAAFDGVLMNAHALDVRGDGDDAMEARNRVLAMVDAVTSLAPLAGPVRTGLKLAARQGARALPAPSRRDMTDEAYVFEQRVHRGLRASIVAGFRAQRVLDDGAVAELRSVASVVGVAPPLDDDGHVLAYNHMSDLQRVAFDTWLLDARLPRGLERALAAVDRTLAAGDYDV